MSVSKKPPEAIRSNTVASRVLRQKVWRPMNVQNLHFMGAIVGREGFGKSWTALSIGEKVDPTFTADRVMFSPGRFLHKLQEWKEAGETRGKFIVADEAGVGLGVRTWYEKDQIKFNQVLQVIRDENMGILFTLPRLNELDSQARGRLHAFLEVVDKEDGEYAEIKWKNMDPTRDDKDKIYKKYPRMRVDGTVRVIRRIRIGPPSPELAEDYEAKKNAFQAELYQDAIDEREGVEEEEKGPKDIYEEIVGNGGVQPYVSLHGNTGEPYVDPELLELEYDVSQRDARKIKKLLERDPDVELVA